MINISTYMTHLDYRFIFNNIIIPLARSWKRPKVRDVIKSALFVLKPKVRFPLLSPCCL